MTKPTRAQMRADTIARYASVAHLHDIDAARVLGLSRTAVASYRSKERAAKSGEARRIETLKANTAARYAAVAHLPPHIAARELGVQVDTVKDHRKQAKAQAAAVAFAQGRRVSVPEPQTPASGPENRVYARDHVTPSGALISVRVKLPKEPWL